jgi:hypothetical protein
MIFGAAFILTGAFSLLLPIIAPERQGDTPVWVNILGGLLFILVGIGVHQIQRDPRTVPFWAGLMCAAIGGFIMVASGFDPDDSRFHAPRWVVAAAGATFLLAGIAAIKSGGQAGPHVDHSAGYGLIIALLLTCFGAVASWVAFGPGERRFDGQLDAGGGLLPFEIGEVIGRILFSPGALLLDVMALAAWFQFFRTWARRNRA